MVSKSDEHGVATFAEILSQPSCWRSCLAILEAGTYLEELRRSFCIKSDWVMVGCGSSYYAGLVAAASWTGLTGWRARAVPASEVLLSPQLAVHGACQPILLSRSGRTSEILKTAEYFREQRGISPIAISCVPHQPLEKLAGLTVMLPPADEKSTVMTRSFSSIVLALQYLAAGWAENKPFQSALKRMPDSVERWLEGIPARLRDFVASREFDDYIFLGQGLFYGIASEAMLKVNEMSCSYAQCFHTLEFRHGPKTIVSPRTLITLFISEKGYGAECDLLEEVKNLGGATLVVTNHAEAAMRRAADFLVELDLDIPESARAVACILVGQLLGLYTGRKKGLDSDHPPNLSRAVILEGQQRLHAAQSWQ